MVGVWYKQNCIPCLKYLTDTYHILTSCQRNKNILSPSGLPSDDAFALGLKPSGKSVVWRQALWRKDVLGHWPRSGYDMYQSHISDKGCNIVYIYFTVYVYILLISCIFLGLLWYFFGVGLFFQFNLFSWLFSLTRFVIIFPVLCFQMAWWLVV